MRDFITKVDFTAPANSGILKAEEDNVRFLEMENLVSSTGISLDPFNGPDSNTEMMAQAYARYASGGIWYQETGAADTYVCSTPLAFILPKGYFAGMIVRFIPGNDNTGPSTLTANGIGSKPVFDYAGDALAGGEILASRMMEVIYDPTADSGSGGWLIAPWATVTASGGSGEVNTAANIGTGTGTFKTKSGAELRFRKVKGANGVSASINGDDVEIDGSGGLGSNLPFYPDVIAANGLVTITDNGGGQIEIDTGQTWTMRGLTLIDTDDYSAPQRQLSHLANKLYHVRFSVAGGFSIVDMTGIDDTLRAYDSSFDDMLIARVVTDGSNAPTITSLINKNSYGLMTEVSGLSVSNSGQNGAIVSYTWSVNLAREPLSWFDRKSVSWGGVQTDTDNTLVFREINRHEVEVRSLYDCATMIDLRINALMVGG